MSWNPNRPGESNFKKKNHFDLSDGDVVAAILPQPKGSYAEYKGAWSAFHSVHFGYKNTEGKFRPFESCQKKDSDKNVVVRDAALDRLNDLKDKLEKAKAEGNAPLAAKLNTLVGMRGVYNVDNNHHMNVVLLDGTIGELKLRYKAKLDLEREIKKLLSEGVDPFSFENGRLFRFSRSGTGSDTSFKVTVYTEKTEALINGNKVMVDNPVVHKVTSDVLSRLETEGFDLETLFQRPTAEEIAQIVAESDLMTGKSPACDRLFDARWKAEREAKKAGKAMQTTPTALPVANQTASAPATTTTPTAQTATLTGPALPAGSVQTATPPAPVQTTVPVQTVAPVQTQAVDDLSDEDFFKQLDLPTEAQA